MSGRAQIAKPSKTATGTAKIGKNEGAKKAKAAPHKRQKNKKRAGMSLSAHRTLFETARQNLKRQNDHRGWRASYTAGPEFLNRVRRQLYPSGGFCIWYPTSLRLNHLSWVPTTAPPL